MEEQKFSRKADEEMLEREGRKADAFWKSPKGLAILRRDKLSEVRHPGVERIAHVIKKFEEVSGITFGEYLLQRRDVTEKECEKVFKAMEPFARAEGYILPYDVDELTGFYFWLVNVSDTGDVPIGRQLFLEFDNFRRKELWRMKMERNKPSIGEELTLDLLNKEESEKFLNANVHKSFIKIEQAATDGTGQFKTAMRCAAFCELAYLGRYIHRVEQSPQKMLIDFANNRYGLFIGNALKGGENMEKRRNHQQRSVSKQPSLISYFAGNDQAKTRLRNQGSNTLNDFNPK